MGVRKFDLNCHFFFCLTCTLCFVVGRMEERDQKPIGTRGALVYMCVCVCVCVCVACGFWESCVPFSSLPLSFLLGSHFFCPMSLFLDW